MWLVFGFKTMMCHNDGGVKTPKIRIGKGKEKEKENAKEWRQEEKGRTGAGDKLNPEPEW